MSLKESSAEALDGRAMWTIVRRFAGYATPYWFWFALSLVCTVMTGAATLVQPYLLKMLFDDVLVGKNTVQALDSLNLICLGILASAVVKGAFNYGQGYCMAFGSQGTAKALREAIFRHLQKLPMRLSDKTRVGEVLSRFTTDLANITGLMTMGLTNMLNDILVITYAVGWMIVKSPGLTLLALLASPLIGLTLSRFGAMINRYSSRVQNRMADLSSHLTETLSSIRVVKSFTREEHEIKRFNDINEDAFASTVKIAQLSVTQAPVVEVLGTFGVVLAIYYGGLGIIRGELTLGELMAFWFFMVLATNPLNRLAGTYAALRQGLVCGYRVFELLDMPTEVEPHRRTVELGTIKGDVLFDDVTFSYAAPDAPQVVADEQTVLRNLTLSVKAGEMIAIVGPNGAGKTSLVNLLPQFYEPKSGRILVDGVDLSTVTLQSLREQIGIVLQDNVLFSGTLRDNLRYGRLDATDDEVVQAAKIGNAHDFIMAFPDGYDSVVGERGVGLSGGQRQRIAFARAVLRNPRILILDEATSALDQEAEASIQEAVERLRAGRTTFVIAHRLQTVRRADRIIVLNNGRIVEEGPHDVLLAKRGLYWRLYEAQQIESGETPVAH